MCSLLLKEHIFFYCISTPQVPEYENTFARMYISDFVSKMQTTATKVLVVIAFLLAVCSPESLNFESNNLLSELLQGRRDFSSSTPTAGSQSTGTGTTSTSSTGEVTGCLYFGEMIAVEAELVVRRRRDIHVCYYAVSCDKNGKVTEVEKECISDSDESETDSSSTPAKK